MRWDNCIFNKLIFAVFMAVILVFLLPLTPSAQAHAILTHSDPETGAALPAAPPRVTLEFSEAIDPDLSKVKLAGADLKDLVPGPGNFDPNEDRFLTLDLPVLPDGAYNIIWQARSAVDGHISSGVVTFSIGEATSRASLLPPPGADDPTQALPPLPDTLIRWLAYAAAALLVGGVLFGWLVWRPAYRAWGSRDPGSDRLAAHRLRQLIRTGIAALAALSLGTMLFQTWEAGRGDFQISYSQALAGLLEPQSGWAFWLRLSLLGFLAYLTRRLTHPGEGSPRIWQAAAVVALAILLTFSLQSHVAALDSPLAVALDWLHITAMGAWFGGLPPLFLLLRQTDLPPHLLVPKFSRLALVCVATLAISGLYIAYLQVRNPQALTETIFGLALSAKTVLFALVIGLGAFNLLALSPRLKSSGKKASRWLMKTIPAELAIGFLILAAAGLMTGVPPAFEAVQARQRMGFVGEYQEREVRFVLWIAPARAGENEIAVDVYGLNSEHHEAHPQVLLRFQPEDAGLGTNQVEAFPNGGSIPGSGARYTARGSVLTISGTWQVEVILRQPGANDIRHVFSVDVLPALESGRLSP